MRLKNVRVLIAHLNINSIRNKFELLADGINKNLDIFMISETKLDETFPTRQFFIEGFSMPYILDRNGHGVVSLYILGKILHLKLFQSMKVL